MKKVLHFAYAIITNKCNIITVTIVNESKQKTTVIGSASVVYLTAVSHKTPLQKPKNGYNFT